MQSMGYGGMRGGGGPYMPQPQRNSNRRNNRQRGGGGGGGGGGSRFESRSQPGGYQHARQQHQNNQQQQRKDTPNNNNKGAQQTQQQQQQTAQAIKPEPVQAEVKAAVPQKTPTPQKAEIQQKPAIAPKPQPVVNQQPAPTPPKPVPAPQQNKSPAVNNQQNSIQNQQKPQPNSNVNSNANKGNNQQNNNGPKPLQHLKLNPPANHQNNMNANKGNAGYQGNNNMNNSGGQGGGSNRGVVRRHMGQEKGGPGARDEHFMLQKLKDIAGSTLDLQPLDQSELKFSGRNRLYVGNLTNDITEQEILEIFQPYGETAELFLNREKNFAFIRIDYKANADKAKREVDGRMRRGRPLRVRFAPHNAAIRVKNLTPFVTNELLYKSFEIFGKIERAVVKVDERGKSLGEGIVEYSRKAGAMAAIRHCTERCYFLTASLRPVVVESYEEVDEADGYTEKTLPRKNQDYVRAREIGPRFAEPGSFEHEYGTRWKQMHELFKQKEDALKREMHMEEEKLEAQMEYAKYEHETELLREQLRAREQDRERQKRSWEIAQQQAEEQREKEREVLMLQEENMAQRMRHQEDELRRRQKENTLFMQAQQLNRILDEQEQGMSGGRYDSSMQDIKRPFDSGMGGNMQMDSQYYDQMCGPMGYEDGMGRWDSRQEDYPNKRRRY